MRVGPENVGARVVLRYRLGDGRATDVLGDLLAWDESGGEALVGTRAGPVRVPLADLLMGKPVPPPPEPRARRLSVAALHEVMALGWGALEVEEYPPEGRGWRLRAAQGFTGRSNSVLPLGPPPVALPAAVDHAERWYAERGLPARFCVTWELGHGPDEDGYGDDPLEAELARRDYVLDFPTLVMTRRTQVTTRETDSATTGSDLRLDVADDVDESWLGLYHYRGQELPPIATTILRTGPAVAFLSLRDGDGRAVAIARAASGRGWVGLSAIEVGERHRRRGLAQRLVGAALAWGRERGDHSAYLQVARANGPARALYDRLGFTDHSGYHYRIRS